jgi:hypothetical protein
VCQRARWAGRPEATKKGSRAGFSEDEGEENLGIGKAADLAKGVKAALAKTATP